jgi:hypothetical protein
MKSTCLLMVASALVLTGCANSAKRPASERDTAEHRSLLDRCREAEARRGMPPAGCETVATPERRRRTTTIIIERPQLPQVPMDGLGSQLPL